MQIEEAMKEIEYAKSFGTSGVVPRWEAIETVINYVKMMQSELDRLEGIEDNTSMLKQELEEQKEANKELNKVLIHFKAVINEMAECINSLGWSDLDNNEEIKEYFSEKVGK